MDPIRRLGRPALRHPRALLAWEGWNDASDAASGALAYLLGQFELEPFVVIEPEEFYDFQVHRPRVKVAEGGTRRLTWPATRFYAVELPEQPGDLVIVTADEPNLRWKTYSRLVAQVLSDVDVEAVVTLGAFIGEVAHTVPVPLIGVATEPRLLAAHHLTASGYEGPTGIVGVLHTAFRDAGIPSASLWATVPTYVASAPSPKATLALVDRVSTLLDVRVEATDLAEQAASYEARIDELVADDAETAAYVSQLERDFDDQRREELTAGQSSQELIAEVERYLRDQP